MSESVYRKTPLPVKLNLNDRNTKEQLNSTRPEGSERGTLEGVGLATSASTSQKNCADVMRKDLLDWLEKHGITGPPPTPEAEQRAMWTWMRDFHKEYNDDWFARNMPRLHESFRPVFLAEMKAMKKRAAAEVAAAAKPPASNDLLDFDPPAPASAPAAATNGSGHTGDLLSLDDPVAQTETKREAPAAAAPPPMPGLLDLDGGGGQPAPGGAAPPAGGTLLGGLGQLGAAAAPVAAAPAPAVALSAPPAAKASPLDGLLDFDLGLPQAGTPAPLVAPMVPTAVPAAAVAQPAAPQGSKEAALLDLIF